MKIIIVNFTTKSRDVFDVPKDISIEELREDLIIEGFLLQPELSEYYLCKIKDSFVNDNDTIESLSLKDSEEIMFIKETIDG